MTRRPELEKRIDAALGRGAADLVVRNVHTLDVISGGLTRGDVAVVGDTIVGVGGEYRADRVVDGGGLYAAPGFIDAHVHIESSCLTPGEFERCVLPRGVTSLVWDPHEIANVLGRDALAYALESAEAAAMDIRVALSSCVPATHLETSGARLLDEDLLPFADHPLTIGLAELMNFPGVLSKDAEVLDKIAAFAGRHIDGHAPLLRGVALDAYLAAGVRTDHESISADEAREKLRKGMFVFVREGSVSKDLAALARVISADTSAFMAFCTDDRNPLDIAHEGHLDYLIRRAIAAGAPRHHVYRMASHSAAAAFGLRDRGLLAPGWRADLVLLGSLEGCEVQGVICGGREVDEAMFAERRPTPPIGLDSMKAAPVDLDTFAVPAKDGERPVIGVTPGRIVTERLSAFLPAGDGWQLVDTDQDVIKVAVVERHGRSGGRAVGFVRGFGLKRGAIASSVAHDSHNLTIVGADDAAMRTAANRVIALGGGFVVADGENIAAEMALPSAGLMSLEPFETVAGQLQALRAAAASLGCTLPEPFLQVSFLALPVIPHLKITDLGLVDVDRFAFV